MATGSLETVTYAGGDTGYCAQYEHDHADEVVGGVGGRGENGERECSNYREGEPKARLDKAVVQLGPTGRGAVRVVTRAAIGDFMTVCGTDTAAIAIAGLGCAMAALLDTHGCGAVRDRP